MILRDKDEYSSQEEETSESEENEKRKKEIENPSDGLFEKEEDESRKNEMCTALVVGCDDVASCYSIGVLRRRQVGRREGSRGARVVASC